MNPVLNNIEDLFPHKEEKFITIEYRNIPWKNFVSLFESNRARLPERWKPTENHDFLRFILKDCEAHYKRDERGNYYLHREFDKPAWIGYNSVRIWYKNGKPHRENGPAFVSIRKGIWEWCYNGKWHRSNNKPAIYDPKKGYQYCVNHKLHRTDGPAIDYKNTKRFFIDGVEYSEKDFWKKVNK